MATATHRTPRASRRRIDHLPLYLCVVTSQAVIATIILAQLIYTTLWFWASPLIETVAASALGLSALACLFAAASGTPRFRPGADIRDCYTVAAWALLLMVISMAVFWIGIWHAGGHPGEVQMILLLMAAVMLGLLGKVADFHREIRRLSDELVRRVSIGVGDD